jgi:hypothetical protein
VLSSRQNFETTRMCLAGIRAVFKTNTSWYDFYVFYGAVDSTRTWYKKRGHRDLKTPKLPTQVLVDTDWARGPREDQHGRKGGSPVGEGYRTS